MCAVWSGPRYYSILGVRYCAGGCGGLGVPCGGPGVLCGGPGVPFVMRMRPRPASRTDSEAQACPPRWSGGAENLSAHRPLGVTHIQYREHLALIHGLAPHLGTRQSCTPPTKHITLCGRHVDCTLRARRTGRPSHLATLHLCGWHVECTLRARRTGRPSHLATLHGLGGVGRMLSAGPPPGRRHTRARARQGVLALATPALRSL